MALPETVAAGVGGGQAEGVEPAPGHQRDPVRAEDRLSVAATASGVSGVDRGLLLLLPLVEGRDVGASPRQATRTAAAEGRAA